MDPIEDPAQEELDEDGNPVGTLPDNGEYDAEGNPLTPVEPAEPELDADGNPIEGENTPAAPVDAVPTTPTSEAAPVDTPTFALPDAPAAFAYRGEEYAVAADGESLYDRAYEDQESAEAQAVIEALIRYYGGDPDDPDSDETIRATGRAQVDYDRLQGRYDIAKERYETHRERQIETSLQTGLDGLKTQVTTVQTQLHNDWLSPVPEAARTEIFGVYHAEASRLIEGERQKLIADNTSRGMDIKRATVRADAVLLSTPHLYNQALVTALASDFGGFMERIFTALNIPKTSKNAAAIAKAAGGVVPQLPALQTPQAGIPPAAKPAPTPRPPAPPGMGPSRGATGNPGGAAKIIPTQAEISAAGKFGVDPVRFATHARKGK